VPKNRRLGYVPPWRRPCQSANASIVVKRRLVGSREDYWRNSAPSNALELQRMQLPPGIGSLHPVAEAATSSLDILRRARFHDALTM